MRTRIWGVGGVVGLLVVVGPTHAQQLVNPSRLLFDHDAVSRAETTTYKVGYFAAGAGQPVHVVDVPKDQTAPDGGSFTAALPRPALGLWQVRVQACAGALCSDWSVPTDPFGLSPRAPVSLRVAP